MRKIQPCKFRKFCIFLYYMHKIAQLLAQKWCKLLHVIQKYTKFTNFKMLFPAVVMYFVNSGLDKNLVYSWNHLLIDLVQVRLRGKVARE